MAASRRNLTLSEAVADVERRFIAANPKSQARAEAAARVMPGGNTRSVQFYDPFPVAIVKGEGQRVTDLDGHTYTDFLGEFTAGLYGHSEPAIVAAIKAALDDGLVLGGPNMYEARLAELMCARFPAVELVRFCNSGSEATLLCVSLARSITGRERVMVVHGAYHGSFLSFPGGKPAHLNAPFPVVTVDYNDATQAADRIRAEGDRLACVILEPLMGSGGCIPATEEFLKTIRVETERAGAALIFDEVMTSRLAPGGLHGAHGLKPDLVAFGKYLGGGVTFGAFGGRRDWMARLDPARQDSIVHSGTYNNNVLTMAAGIAGLEKVFTPTAAERLNASGERLRSRLNAAASARGLPFQATGRGSMINLHPTGRPILRPADHAHVPSDARKLLHLDLNLRGNYLARRGFMALSLPLIDADHDALVQAFESFLDEHAGVLGSLE